MIEQGLVDEVRRLMADENAHPTAMQAIGYKEIAAALRGDIPMDEAVRLTKQATRRFAKRQMTWFRNRKQKPMKQNAPSHMSSKLSWTFLRMFSLRKPLRTGKSSAAHSKHTGSLNTATSFI